MENAVNFTEKLRFCGIGRRKVDDDIFNSIYDKPPRLGVYDMDDENLCHEVVNMTCSVPGCIFLAESLLEYEDHYNSSHRYMCAQCKKILPSLHFLDLHLQENHDSFFAVLAQKKPSFCCYIQECKEKFTSAEERHDHSIKVHKLPKDFRFEQRSKCRKKMNDSSKAQMNIDPSNDSKNKIMFSNCKQKTFSKYTGKKFTKNTDSKTNKDVNMDIMVEELKDSLPN